MDAVFGTWLGSLASFAGRLNFRVDQLHTHSPCGSMRACKHANCCACLQGRLLGSAVHSCLGATCSGAWASCLGCESEARAEFCATMQAAQPAAHRTYDGPSLCTRATCRHAVRLNIAVPGTDPAMSFPNCCTCRHISPTCSPDRMPRKVTVRYIVYAIGMHTTDCRHLHATGMHWQFGWCGASLHGPPSRQLCFSKMGPS